MYSVTPLCLLKLLLVVNSEGEDVMALGKVKNRFMFDTNALNRICVSPEDEMMIYQSKLKGFEYYFSEIQCLESSANIEKVSSGVDAHLVERQRAEWAVNLLRVIPKLQTQYVGQIATFVPNRWKLDGTFEFLPDGEAGAAALFADILNQNDCQYYNDAMIAMTAVVNGCTLVTNDKRLFKKVNAHFPGRAIQYEDFVALL